MSADGSDQGSGRLMTPLKLCGLVIIQCSQGNHIPGFQDVQQKKTLFSITTPEPIHRSVVWREHTLGLKNEGFMTTMRLDADSCITERIAER